MKSFIVTAVLLVLVALSGSASAGGYGGGFIGGGIGYGHGPRVAIGPQILYGGYRLTSHSVSGPILKGKGYGYGGGYGGYGK